MVDLILERINIVVKDYPERVQVKVSDYPELMSVPMIRDYDTVEVSVKNFPEILTAKMPMLNHPHKVPVSITPSFVPDDVPQHEADALIRFYNATGGDSWTDNTNWMVDSTVGNWYGVTVSGGHVTEIDLSSNGLNGDVGTTLDDFSDLYGNVNLSDNASLTNVPIWTYNVAKFDLTSDLVDDVSGNAMSVTRDGDLIYLGTDDLYHTAGVNEAAIGKYGLYHDGAGTNLIPYARSLDRWINGDSLATQGEIGVDGEPLASLVTDNSTDARQYILQYLGDAVSGTNGQTHCFSTFIKKAESAVDFISRVSVRFKDAVWGTIYAQNIVNINTYTGETQGNTHTIEDIGDFWRLSLLLTNPDDGATGAFLEIYAANKNLDGDFDSTLTGSIVVDGTQFELNKSFPSSSIFTNGAAASRATQAADVSGNGLSIALADLNSRISTAIADDNTHLFRWIPKVAYNDIAAGTYGLIGYNDEAGSGVYIDGSGNIVFNDGTNTVTHSVQWAADDVIDIAVVCSGSTATVRTSVNGAAWTETAGSYDGAIPYTDTLRPGFSLEIPCWFGPQRVYDKALTETEIESEVAAW